MLLLGLALGGVATVSKQYAGPDYGETINGDRDFERSLTAAAPGGEPGKRVFHDLVVHPVRIAGDDGPRDVHVVTGRYVSAGGVVRQRCYVASIPYRPVRGGSRQYAFVCDYRKAAGIRRRPSRSTRSPARPYLSRSAARGGRWSGKLTWLPPKRGWNSRGWCRRSRARRPGPVHSACGGKSCAA